MSTQRRRVLENSGLIIPADGVYIEGLDGRAYTVDNWKGGNDANSIVVASGDVKFRIALTDAPSTMMIYSSGTLEGTADLQNYLTALAYPEALVDYDGAGNTANILKKVSSTGYAAGYCDAFVFPDGKTKGYLPALGQLNLAYQNKSAVDTALSKCGGAALDERFYYYWSSTFWGVNDSNALFWYLIWDEGYVEEGYVMGDNYVRPFADIS